MSHGTESRKKRVYTPLCDISNSVTEENDITQPTPTIHNIVSTSKIVCIPPANNTTTHRPLLPILPENDETKTTPQPSYIDLDRIHKVVQCSHYNRKKFAAITIRIDDPTVTALLFTSGRLVITGSKSWYECMLASLVIVRILREVQPECHFYVQVSLFSPFCSHSNAQSCSYIQVFYRLPPKLPLKLPQKRPP